MKTATIILLLAAAAILCAAAGSLVRQQRRSQSQYIEVTDYRGQQWFIKTDEVKCIMPGIIHTNVSQIFLENGLVVSVGQSARTQIVFRMFGN